MKHAIQARGLHKRYGQGDASVEALRGVDLDIVDGEFVSIMGTSGSGKSTLLHLIGLLDAPTSGRIRMMGEDASHFNDRQRTRARREYLGFVFQAFHLLPRATAAQNVMLPMALAGVPRSERRQRAQEALEAVGLGDRSQHRPNELSGGQKQRVAIARSLALDPPIILADEPTGNLDSKTSREVMELFTQLNRDGKTIIQVTHEPTMADFSDRIIRIHDGRVADAATLGDWNDGAEAATPPEPADPAPGPRPENATPQRARPVGKPRVVFKEWTPRDRR